MNHELAELYGELSILTVAKTVECVATVDKCRVCLCICSSVLNRVF